MSHSRTLVRKLLADQARRQQPENLRIKPGTPNRRVVSILNPAVPGCEMLLHHTKGVRIRRAT